MIDLLGQKFSELIVTSRAPNSKDGQTRWICECSCGTKKTILGKSLRQGKTKTCGCRKGRKIKYDLKGSRFGHWLVISKAPSNGGCCRWKCQCSCGEVKAISSVSLRQGKSKGCSSCCHKTHGLKSHRLYTNWRAMNDRCYNPNATSFKSHGARGVSVCERWHKDNPNGMKNFVQDMDKSYFDGATLDKDKKAIPGKPKVYSPETCCWLTRSENSRLAQLKLQE